ncbi:MAG: Wzz/FepE/Etk N-terminal domain-containing protein [Candidatus Cloacimonetes bacterium]|nr:Wzz/FepE/Etk N-terminal domain-containing protein [Candidatus Cloacimonadota bacterium]
MESQHFDLFELIRIILANRKMIIILVLAVAITAVIYSLLTPQIWSSKATFFAVGDDVNGLPFNIPGMSGISASLLGKDSSDKAVNFITVLQSRSFSEEVIRKYKLIPYFNLHDPDSLLNMDFALQKLSNNVMSIGVDDTNGLISIKAATKNKQLSKDIVEHYLARLDKYNRSQKITQGKLNREFLEIRVKETRAILDSLIAVNRKFQEDNKAIDLETQARGILESYASLVAEKMKLEIELELNKSTYGATSPILKDLNLKLGSISSQIKSLENSGKVPKAEYLLDISKIPGMSSQYAQIKMNRQIYQTVYEYLYPQYEAARLTELRDMPTIEILDMPRLAGKRDSPRRAMICILSTLLAFVLGVGIALVKEVLSKQQNRIKMVKDSLSK